MYFVEIFWRSGLVVMKKMTIAFICIAMLSVACGNAQNPQSSSSMSSIDKEMSDALSGFSQDMQNSQSMESSQSMSVDSSEAMNIANSLLAAIKPQGEFMALSSGTVKNFYTLPEAAQYGIHVSASWTGEEIAVLKLNGSKDALVEALKTRLSALKTSLKDYKDDVYATVEANSVILTCGDYVVFLSGTKENVDAARAALETAVGAKAEVVS